MALQLWTPICIQLPQSQASLVAGNLYCQYNSATLQLMTSTLFIAGAICELTGTTGALLERMMMLAFWPEPGQNRQTLPPSGKC